MGFRATSRGFRAAPRWFGAAPRGVWSSAPWGLVQRPVGFGALGSASWGLGQRLWERSTDTMEHRFKGGGGPRQIFLEDQI